MTAGVGSRKYCTLYRCVFTKLLMNENKAINTFQYITLGIQLYYVYRYYWYEYINYRCIFLKYFTLFDQLNFLF